MSIVMTVPQPMTMPRHRHLHLHVRGANNHRRHVHASSGLGLLHGLAGASHLLAVIPAWPPPPMPLLAIWWPTCLDPSAPWWLWCLWCRSSLCAVVLADALPCRRYRGALDHHRGHLASEDLTGFVLTPCAKADQPPLRSAGLSVFVQVVGCRCFRLGCLPATTAPCLQICSGV